MDAYCYVCGIIPVGIQHRLPRLQEHRSKTCARLYYCTNTLIYIKLYYPMKHFLPHQLHLRQTTVCAEDSILIGRRITLKSSQITVIYFFMFLHFIAFKRVGGGFTSAVRSPTTVRSVSHTEIEAMRLSLQDNRACWLIARRRNHADGR
jgi:hypothetical protein